MKQVKPKMYIRMMGNTFIEAERYYIVDLDPKLTIFAYLNREFKLWGVYDAITGAQIGFGRTKKNAVELSKRILQSSGGVDAVLERQKKLNTESPCPYRVDK